MTAPSSCASTTARSTRSPADRRPPATRSSTCSGSSLAPVSNERRTSSPATAAAPTSSRSRGSTDPRSGLLALDHLAGGGASLGQRHVRDVRDEGCGHRGGGDLRLLLDRQDAEAAEGREL